MNDHDGPPAHPTLARPPRRRLLRALLAATAFAALLAAAATGWIHYRDQQVIARYTLQAADAATPDAVAIDLLLETCARLPTAVRTEIVDAATLVHAEDSGDWSSGRREIKVYRHRYLDYYVDYTTGFFPVQHRFCRVR